jgi:hypothetical protein
VLACTPAAADCCLSHFHTSLVTPSCRGIFVVNQPRYMNFLWALVRPFMKKKLRERVHFIGTDVAAFHEFIDPQVLPPEFGGTLEVRGQWAYGEQALCCLAA